MDQEDAGARKPKENTGARKRKRDFLAAAAAGEPQQQDDKAVAVAAVVGTVAECVQQEEDYEGISEESIAEMMRWLALDLAMPAADGLANAETSSPPMAPAPGYVNVQGNMQSCGPSFSGSASSVMASVDVRFVSPMPPVLPWPWTEAAPGPQEEEVLDDEWLAGLLTDGPAED